MNIFKQIFNKVGAWMSGEPAEVENPTSDLSVEELFVGEHRDHTYKISIKEFGVYGWALQLNITLYHTDGTSYEFKEYLALSTCTTYMTPKYVVLNCLHHDRDLVLRNLETAKEYCRGYIDTSIKVNSRTEIENAIEKML
ncbi:hypothetical protein NVP1081O_221 [Vibrio phage 1.081.O._10N.286.52.C2]|nr:hypothetical protein NVP1081O_221 [Vibrio phage 1.081.O._10N.286.52.C2]